MDIQTIILKSTRGRCTEHKMIISYDEKGAYFLRFRHVFRSYDRDPRTNYLIFEVERKEKQKVHIRKKYKILIWGGPHGQTKRLPMRLDPHQIQFNPDEKILFSTLSKLQKRTLLAHICGNKECCKEIPDDLDWVYDHV